jgi:hypothetical protein
MRPIKRRILLAVATAILATMALIPFGGAAQAAGGQMCFDLYLKPTKWTPVLLSETVCLPVI